MLLSLSCLLLYQSVHPLICLPLCPLHPNPLVLPLAEEADAPAHLHALSCWQVLDKVRTGQEGVEGEGGTVHRPGDQARHVYDVVITRSVNSNNGRLKLGIQPRITK